MSAHSAMRSVTLACRSSVAAIGTSGPSTSRRAASSVPSPSSVCSATIAPCRLSNTPSNGPSFAAASRKAATSLRVPTRRAGTSARRYRMRSRSEVRSVGNREKVWVSCFKPAIRIRLGMM